MWPQGVYGLPMPSSGCPTGSDFEWETGSRFQDTDDSSPFNEWSSGLHLKGPYARNDMWQHFCMKTIDYVTDPVWPSGQYCVFMYGDDCPTGKNPRNPNHLIRWESTKKISSPYKKLPYLPINQKPA